MRPRASDRAARSSTPTTRGITANQRSGSIAASSASGRLDRPLREKPTGHPQLPVAAPRVGRRCPCERGCGGCTALKPCAATRGPQGAGPRVPRVGAQGKRPRATPLGTRRTSGCDRRARPQRVPMKANCAEGHTARVTSLRCECDRVRIHTDRPRPRVQGHREGRVARSRGLGGHQNAQHDDRREQGRTLTKPSQSGNVTLEHSCSLSLAEGLQGPQHIAVAPARLLSVVALDASL